MESILKLDEILTTEECTAIVNTLSKREGKNWSCSHMQYLLEKSEIPGSGAAKTLGCNLTDFDWKIILTKEDFDTELMRALCSMNAEISDQVLKNIVTSVGDSRTKILCFALDNVKKSPPKEILNSLCTMTLTKKKPNFCSSLVAYGAELNAAEVLKEFSPAEIMSQKTLCNVIEQNTKSCNNFLQYCLKSGDIQAVNYCKTIVQEATKDSIDIAGLIQASTQSTKEKGQRSFNFVKWLLLNKHFGPNGVIGQTSPLEVVSKYPSENQIKLYHLLLKHGANVHKTKLSEQDKAILLENVALAALESGKYFLHHTNSCYILKVISLKIIIILIFSIRRRLYAKSVYGPNFTSSTSNKYLQIFSSLLKQQSKKQSS